MNTTLKILVGLASIVVIGQGVWSGWIMYTTWTAQEEAFAREEERAAITDCDAKVSTYISERTLDSKADAILCLAALRSSAFFSTAMKRLADSGAPLHVN